MTLFTIISTYSPLAAEKSGGTIDRVTTDSPYSKARCTGAWLYFEKLHVEYSLNLWNLYFVFKYQKKHMYFVFHFAFRYHCLLSLVKSHIISWKLADVSGHAHRYVRLRVNIYILNSWCPCYGEVIKTWSTLECRTLNTWSPFYAVSKLRHLCSLHDTPVTILLAFLVPCVVACSNLRYPSHHPFGLLVPCVVACSNPRYASHHPFGLFSTLCCCSY